MNSSAAPGGEPKAVFRDDSRLLIAALVCGAGALAVLPFEPPILRMCNLEPMSSSLGLWDWMDRRAPAIFTSGSLVLGALILLFARPSEKSRRAALGLLVAFGLALLVAQGLKLSTKRDRPLANVDRAGKLWSPLDLKDDRSFPSGHVTAATAIAAALWLAGRRGIRNVVWAIPPMMMYDRVCLAAHWPSDVLGAAALGLASAGAVAWAARLEPVDRFVARLGRGRPAFGRFLLVAFVWLVVTRIWGELPLGRDPVSGEVVPGFETKPHLTRILLEPFVGPPLHAALEDVGRTWVPGLAWAVAIVATLWFATAKCGRPLRVRLVAAGVVLVGAWVAIFLTGVAPPDRFVSKDRTGEFVDWHLHGGDPFDGARSASVLEARQRARNVSCAVMTAHSSLGAPASEPLANGLAGTEWSGRLPKRGDPWRTPHVLVLGSSEDTIREVAAVPSVLDAVRLAVSKEAFVIVAHFWRTQATVPDCPTVEQLVEAGVRGFEVGNHHRETDPEALERLRELDRRCRELGVRRFSFSDDHGIPAGSPCVTFVEGAAPGRGPEGVEPIPLLFFPGDPTVFPPRWLAPPVMGFEYFRSLHLEQRAAWFAFAALVGFCLFRPRRAKPEGPVS